METEGSLFETSEMVANMVASTSIIVESWKACMSANSKSNMSEGFVINENGGGIGVGMVGFCGVKDFRNGGSDLLVPLQHAANNGLFTGLGSHAHAHAHAHGEDDDEEPPVMVHAGLLQLFLDVYATSSFQTQMKSLLEKNNKSIIITGHSVGGALASLTALWILSYLQTIPTPPQVQVLCITFGSPLLGNKSLSKSLRQRWAGNFCHVVLKHDIIPRLLFARLHSIDNQLFFFLHHIQSSMNSQLTTTKSPLHVSQEMKTQLFCFALAYTEAVTKGTNGDDFDGPDVFWPFGHYLLCSNDGAICVDNSVSVIKLLHLMMATSDMGSCLEDHLRYGSCVEKLSFHILMNKGLTQGNNILPTPPSSYEEGLALALESSGLAATQESVLEEAKNCLKMAKQTGVPPSIISARLAIRLAKITPNRAQIEWYKTCCDKSDNQLGYYDSFKQRQASKRDNQVNMFRIKLADFWDSIIIKIDNNELPHDFQKRLKFINASHFYQLLVEPLDIAEYYRSGEHLRKGHYLSNGRERRHEIFSKWWREKEVVEGDSKRSQFASLTQDSCFWARVEEARELVEKLRVERNMTNLAHLWQSIEAFESYARKMIENKEVSCDVVAKNSSYSLWINEVREERSQVQVQVQVPVQSFDQLSGGFRGGEMVPSNMNT